MAPPKPQRTLSDSRGSMENLFGVDKTTGMPEKKYRAPQPSSPPGYDKHRPKNEAQVNSFTCENSQRPSIPLPDYEALFPKRRHGVMSNTHWEHIIAEVNQRNMTLPDGEKEMSVDGSDESMSIKTSAEKNKSARDYPEVSSAFTKTTEPKQALIPPKPGNPGPSDQSQQDTKMNVKGNLNPMPDSTLVQISEPGKEKPIPTARTIKKPTDRKSDVVTPGLPQAKSRQGASSKEPVKQVQPEQTMQAFTSSASSQVEGKKGSTATKILWENERLKEGKPTPVNITDKTVNTPKDPFANVTSAPDKKTTEFDPFPSDQLISQDPWALPQQTMDPDDLFINCLKNVRKPEDQRLSTADFDNIFGSAAFKNDPFFAPKDEASVSFESVTSRNRTNSHNASRSSLNVYSQKKKLAPQPPEKPVLQEADDVELTVTSLAQPEAAEPTGKSQTRNTLYARVSPSEVQSGTPQSSGGGGVLTSRR